MGPRVPLEAVSPAQQSRDSHTWGRRRAGRGGIPGGLVSLGKDGTHESRGCNCMALYKARPLRRSSAVPLQGGQYEQHSLV